MSLTKTHRFVRNLWYKKNGLRFFLWPFSLLFKGIVITRKKAYQMGLKKITTVNCPVIVIGNITVGGTGKTPLTIALARFLSEKKLQPGIIIRGYKGCVKKPEIVFAHSDPRQVGDEALLLARRSNCPVVVCPDRVAAANFLLQKTRCNVILSDDGLQHFALGRKLEIAVIDGTLGFGNGMLLPAGPLREPISRLQTVDFCVINQPENVPHKSTNISYAMSFYFNDLINIKQKNAINMDTFQRTKKIHAVAGIGNPSRFFNLIRMQGLSIIEHEFPDHHVFVPEDFDFLKHDEWVIMTEKDAVKCEVFADERYWYLPINAKLPDEFFKAVFNSLQETVV